MIGCQVLRTEESEGKMAGGHDQPRLLRKPELTLRFNNHSHSILQYYALVNFGVGSLSRNVWHPYLCNHQQCGILFQSVGRCDSSTSSLQLRDRPRARAAVPDASVYLSPQSTSKSAISLLGVEGGSGNKAVVDACTGPTGVDYIQAVRFTSSLAGAPPTARLPTLL